MRRNHAVQSVVRFGSLFWLLAVAATPATAIGFTSRAHPISVTEADVYVTRTKVVMRLAVFLEDVYLFQDLQPDEQGLLAADVLREAAEKHKKFLLERVKVLDARGELLRPQLTNYVPPEILAASVATGDLMQYSMTYQLEFEYAEPPEFLTFQQDMVDANFLFPSEMKILVKQSGEDSPRLAMLRPGDPYTVRFDWSRPPLAKDATDKEWDDWLKRERDETLGITSYGSVYSFIYITPRQVRHEILIPLASLIRVVSIPRRDPNFLDVDEQPEAARIIQQYLEVGNPVVLNGSQVPPHFDRVDFYGLDLRDFAMQADARRVSMASGRVGVILSYPAPQAPLTGVKLTWDQFSSTIRNVESVVFAGEDGPVKASFSQFQEENTFQWEGPSQTAPQVQPAPVQRSPADSSRFWMLAIAVLFSVGIGAGGALNRKPLVFFVGVAALAALAGLWTSWPASLRDPWTTPSVPPVVADQVFAQLQDNTYRAFEYSDENQIYDALNTSVDGGLLRELYLKMLETLKMQEQGGALLTIQEVKRLEGEAEPDGRGGFHYRCRWIVRGVVEHWGHVHQRTNQYIAEFHVQDREQLWKITDMNITEQERLNFQTRIRKF